MPYIDSPNIIFRGGDKSKWQSSHANARKDAIMIAKKRLKRAEDYVKKFGEKLPKDEWYGEWVWACYCDPKTKKPYGRPWRYCNVEVFESGKIFYIPSVKERYRLDSNGRIIGTIPLKNGKVHRPY